MPAIPLIVVRCPCSSSVILRQPALNEDLVSKLSQLKDSLAHCAQGPQGDEKGHKAALTGGRRFAPGSPRDRWTESLPELSQLTPQSWRRKSQNKALGHLLVHADYASGGEQSGPSLVEVLRSKRLSNPFWTERTGDELTRVEYRIDGSAEGPLQRARDELIPPQRVPVVGDEQRYVAELKKSTGLCP